MSVNITSLCKSLLYIVLLFLISSAQCRTCFEGSLQYFEIVIFSMMKTCLDYMHVCLFEAALSLCFILMYIFSEMV